VILGWQLELEVVAKFITHMEVSIELATSAMTGGAVINR
jgi:hypothetical protein